MLSKLAKPGVIAVVADSPDVTVDNNIEAPPASPEPAEESHKADGYDDEPCWDCAEEDTVAEGDCIVWEPNFYNLAKSFKKSIRNRRWLTSW